MMGSITNIPLLMLFILSFSSATLSKTALFNSSSDASCIESELEALLEFKASLGSESSSLSSWSGSNCCSWDGITCHNLTGHVQNLDLVYHRYNSSLSPWLFNLSHLEVLKIPGSGFRGPIPDMFDKLTSLTYLDLSRHSFNSSLPLSLFDLTHLKVLSMHYSGLIGLIPDMFHKLASLTYLDLSDNSFDSPVFPDSLCSLTSLTVMQLGSNRIQGSLPYCLGNLTSLTTLDVSNNEMSGGIPDGLGNLTNLTNLDLSFNRFNSSIPSTFGNLRDLQLLYLQDNQLSGEIPSTLGNLANLTHFFVSDNSLAGELSEIFFEGLENLQELDISKNQHLVLNVSHQWIPTFHLSSILMDSVFIGTEFPPWLRTQNNLQKLSLGNASIIGAIPNWFLTACPNLTNFDAPNNQLNGSIPTFPNLVAIDLSNNLFSGSIPTFDSAPLQILDLSWNQFSGNISYQLCNLTSLFTLSLANNNLAGMIPSCLGAIQMLLVLNLENNILSGHIPHELGSMSIMLMLHLNGNEFSGEVPRSFHNLTRLVTLDLGQNKLQGFMLPGIGKNWVNLQYLRLESNNIFGEIPVNLCQLPSLQILNLARNNFVGTIPPCLGNLSKMLSSESGSRFDSSIYSEALLNIIKGREAVYTSSLPYAKFISLSGNHLYGEIPTELMNLKGLQSLNVSNNELSGMIPENINNLKHLEALDLSMNRLSGSIPQSLADIDALSYLNLSFNNLAGRIPSGNHFDTLNDPSIYEGNVGLCGKLLMMSCPGDDSPKGPVYDADAGIDEEVDLLPWLYAGIGPGFAVGFVGVMCILYFKDPWRIAFFGFVDNLNEKVRTTLTIKMSMILSKSN